MKKILAYILSPIFWLTYGLLLVIFHPIQLVCHWIGGYSLRKKSVDFLNFFLIYSPMIMGARIRLIGFEQVPKQGPFIIVSNHQSFFDIPPVVWGFKKYHPRYVSKKELSKGIPSVSYNLRHGGSALIERKNPKQAIMEIARLGRLIEKEKCSASIFPEGTRSKTGQLRNFQHAGIAALLKKAPSALIVPLVIDGNNRLIKEGYFPLQFGVQLNYKVLPPIDPKGRDPKELAQSLQEMIKNELEHLK